MKAKGIIAVLAIVGLLVFVAVSVFGGNKERGAALRTVSRAAVGEVHSGVRHLVSSPFDTKQEGVPGQINYQGYLVDAEDSSAITGTLEMIFEIFDDPEYGYPLWSDTLNVEVISGLFNVLLGTPDSLFTGQELWLQTIIGGERLWPRKKLVSVPYGFRSEVADKADLATWADSAEYALSATPDDDWIISGDNIYRLTGNVGIGTENPDTKLTVSNTIRARGFLGLSTEKLSIAGYDNGFGGGRGIQFNAIEEGFDFQTYYPNSWGTRFYIADNGNVGIGTENPSHQLHITGHMRINDQMALYFYNSAGTYHQGVIYANDVTDKFYVHSGVDRDLWLGSYGDIEFNTYESDWSEKMTIKTNGRVGIGTTNPSAKLAVYTGDAINAFQVDRLKIGYGSDIDGVSNGSIFLNSNGTGNVLLVNGGGNVGIGMTSPARKLHVNDVMRLEPRATAPSDPSEGDMYMDSNDHKLKVYDGTTWQSCW